MMRGRRFFLLISIMVVVCLTITGISLWILYGVAVKEQRDRLKAAARSQARLMEAVFRYNSTHGKNPSGALEATLTEIKDAHKNDEGFGETGEFTLARREGDRMVFLFRHGNDDRDTPMSVKIDSGLAVPMTLALSGKSGTVKAVDHRGEKVLAAYEPLKGLRWGIVAKVDMDEIRAPFVRAALIVLGAMILLVGLGASLFHRISNPIIRELEDRNRELKETNIKHKAEIEIRKRAEKALDERELEYRELVQNANSAILRWKIDGTLRFVNDYALDFFGYERAEIIGRDVRILFPEEDSSGRDPSGPVQDIVSEPEKYANSINENVRRDGSRVWMAWTNKPIFDKGGNIEEILAIGTDITDFRRVEEELRYNKSMAELAASAANIGYWGVNPNTKEVYFSKEWKRLLGYDEDELPNRVREWRNRLHPEDYDRSIEILKAFVEGRDSECALDLRLKHKDGSYRWFFTQGKKHFDGTGALQGFVGCHIDITELKEAQEQLQILKSKEQLSSLVDNLIDSLMVTDQEGKIKFANNAACELFGRGRDDLVGKDFGFPLVSNELFEMVTHPAEDSTRYAEVKANTIHWEGAPAYLISLRDITERKKAMHERDEINAQFQQAQRMESIGRLAGGVAHDFNNYLNVIVGYSELMMGKLPQEDPLHEFAGEILSAGKRSAALTRQLLAFSRKQTLQPRVINLNDTIRNLEKMLGRLISEDIELRTILTEDLGRVEVDPGQMEQIIMNIAVNARDAMPEGGSLTIETDNVHLDDQYARDHITVSPGDYVLMAISDTGCGMDETTKSHIFEPFFTTKETGKGTGLGMATVYGIVKQSNGHIWVYSEPGKGTTFKIYLPRIHTDAHTREAGPVMVEGRGRGETVMVVEDEPALRVLCKTLLKKMGYSVITAANGAEALLLVAKRDFRPDLVLTDVVMPGMSGKDLVDRLRQTWPDLKVLYMSGYTGNAIVHHGILDEEVDFIEKPFTEGQLSKIIKSLLEQA